MLTSLAGFGIGALFNFTFMGSETPSCPLNAPQEASNSDEYFLQRSLVFAENLKVYLLSLWAGQELGHSCTVLISGDVSPPFTLSLHLVFFFHVLIL